MLPIASDFEQSAEFLMDFLQWMYEQGYEVRRTDSASSDERVSLPQLIVDYLSLDWASPEAEALAMAMLRGIRNRLGPDPVVSAFPM